MKITLSSGRVVLLQFQHVSCQDDEGRVAPRDIRQQVGRPSRRPLLVRFMTSCQVEVDPIYDEGTQERTTTPAGHATAYCSLKDKPTREGGRQRALLQALATPSVLTPREKLETWQLYLETPQAPRVEVMKSKRYRVRSVYVTEGGKRMRVELLKQEEVHWRLLGR